MTKPMLLTVVVAFGLLSVMVSLPVRQVDAQGNTSKDFVPPLVFQAAGPTVESIQGTVDAFRAALGEPNNADNPGPLASGRREINDGRPTPGVSPRCWRTIVYNHTRATIACDFRHYAQVSANRI